MSLKYYKLSKICDIEKGKTGITKAVEGEYPLIATAAEFKSSESYDFDCKAVCIPLVSSTGHGHASINRLHYYDGKFALGTILAKVTSKDEDFIDTKYLYIYLSFFKDEVLVPLMKGSANVSLTVTSLKKLEIPVPSIDVQRKIKELYESVKPLSAFAYEEHNIQFLNIPRLREKILDLAVRGLLVPQDSSDEPASILLEHIEKEKQRFIKEKIIKKSKPLPPIKEEEIPFKLPKGWEWTRLDSISANEEYAFVDGPFGSNLKRIHYSEFGVRIIQLNNIGTGEWKDRNSVFTTEKKADELLRCNAYPGDIVIAKMMPAGRACIVPNINRRYVLCSDSVKLRTHHNISSRYIMNIMNSQPIRSIVYSKSTGITRVRTSLGKLRELIVPLPPLKEQQRIVKRVEELMALCDQLEIVIEESKKNSELLMKAVLKEVFEN